LQEPYSFILVLAEWDLFVDIVLININKGINMNDKDFRRLQERLENANRKMTSARSQEDWNYWSNLKKEIIAEMEGK
jgi:hypothetical protein